MEILSKKITRRQFVQGSALAALGAVLTACGLGQEDPKSIAAKQTEAAAMQSAADSQARAANAIEDQATQVAKQGTTIAERLAVSPATAPATVASTATEAVPTTAPATAAATNPETKVEAIDWSTIRAGVDKEGNIINFPTTTEDFYKAVHADIPVTCELAYPACAEWKDRILVIKNNKSEVIGFEVPVIRSGALDVVSRYPMKNPWSVMQFGSMHDTELRAELGLNLSETKILGYLPKQVGAGIPGHFQGIAEGFVFYKNQSGDMLKVDRQTIEERK